jgi:hypothetical protein
MMVSATLIASFRLHLPIKPREQILHMDGRRNGKNLMIFFYFGILSSGSGK